MDGFILQDYYAPGSSMIVVEQKNDWGNFYGSYGSYLQILETPQPLEPLRNK